MGRKRPIFTRYRVWFDLNNSLTKIIRNNSKFPYELLTFFLGKKTFFDPTKKLKLFRNNRKFPYEKLTFFLGKLLPKILFVLQSSYPWDT